MKEGKKLFRFLRRDFTINPRIILNGDSDNASENIMRGALAMVIPGVLGLVGAVWLTEVHKELGLLLPVVGEFGLFGVGFAEFLRQMWIADIKNIKMDMRFENNITKARSLLIISALMRNRNKNE